MALVPAQLARATVVAGAAAATLHTGPPAGSLIKSVVIARGTGVDAVVTLTVGGVPLLDAVTVKANSSPVIDITQLVASGQTIVASCTGANVGVSIGGAVL